MEDESAVQRPRKVSIPFRSRSTRSAPSGASQNPSRDTSASSSFWRESLASTSKVAPERLEPCFKRRGLFFQPSGCHGVLARGKQELKQQLYYRKSRTFPRISHRGSCPIRAGPPPSRSRGGTVRGRPPPPPGSR